eukprot:396830_1
MLQKKKPKNRKKTKKTPTTNHTPTPQPTAPNNNKQKSEKTHTDVIPRLEMVDDSACTSPLHYNNKSDHSLRIRVMITLNHDTRAIAHHKAWKLHTTGNISYKKYNYSLN